VGAPVPDYPIQHAFLDDTFQKLFKVFAAMSKVLVGFALVALGLSFIGLFDSWRSWRRTAPGKSGSAK
jgi:hypothetical protein